MVIYPEWTSSSTQPVHTELPIRICNIPYSTDRSFSQIEANRLLIAAQQDLLDADRFTSEAADKYRAVARNYLDALSQFMTPGNLGELADQL